MSWPFDPMTSYMAGTTPAIKAADLNAFQTAINGLYRGNRSVVALAADGVGNNVVSPAAGTVNVTRTVSSYTTTPPFSMPAVPVGQLNTERCILGAVNCRANFGSISWCGGFNIYSVTRITVGTYEVTFNNALSADVERHVPLFGLLGVGGAAIILLNTMTIVSGRLVVQVNCRTTALAPADASNFYLAVIGG